MSAVFEEPAKLSLAEKFSSRGRCETPNGVNSEKLCCSANAGARGVGGDGRRASAHAELLKAAYADAAATPVMPADLIDIAKNPVINPVNTGWVLLGAFLVFGMQAGFTMLEAGFCRNRETVNVLVECVFDTCVCGLLHWGWGFAFMFGAGNAFIGWHDPNDPTKSLIFMKDVDVTDDLRRDRHSDLRALPLPVRLRRLRFDDLLRRDGRPHALHRRRPLLRSASPASSIRSSATGAGVRTASSPRWAAKATSCRASA